MWFMDLFIFRLNAFKFLTQNKFNLNNEGFVDIETLFYFFCYFSGFILFCQNGRKHILTKQVNLKDITFFSCGSLELN